MKRERGMSRRGKHRLPSGSIVMAAFLAMWHSTLTLAKESPCAPSWLEGFQCVHEATGSFRLSVHWQYTDDSIRFAVEARTGGWMGLIFAPGEHVADSSGLILEQLPGGTTRIVTVALKSSGSACTRPAERLIVKEASAEAKNGKISLRFEQKIGTKEIAYLRTQPVDLLWAVGSSGEISADLSEARWHSFSIMAPIVDAQYGKFFWTELLRLFKSRIHSDLRRPALRRVLVSNSNDATAELNVLEVTSSHSDSGSIVADTLTDERMPATASVYNLQGGTATQTSDYVVSKSNETVLLPDTEIVQVVTANPENVAVTLAFDESESSPENSFLRWLVLGLMFLIGLVAGSFYCLLQMPAAESVQTSLPESPSRAIALTGSKFQPPLIPVTDVTLSDNVEEGRIAAQSEYSLWPIFSDRAGEGPGFSIVGGLLSNILGRLVKEKLESAENVQVKVGGDSFLLLSGKTTGFRVYLRKFCFEGATTTEAEAHTVSGGARIRFDLGRAQKGGKLLEKSVPLLILVRVSELDASMSIKSNELFSEVAGECWNHIHGHPVETCPRDGPNNDVVFPMALPDFVVRFRFGLVLFEEVKLAPHRKLAKMAITCAIETIDGRERLVALEADWPVAGRGGERPEIGVAGHTKWRKVLDLPEDVEFKSFKAENGFLEYSYKFELDI